MTASPTDQESLEEAYLVLSDLRYLLHQEENTLEDFQNIVGSYYKRIAQSAQSIGEMLPESRLNALDEE